MPFDENDSRAARSRQPEDRLLVTDEAGQVRPIIVWLLGSMMFTAVAVLQAWHVAFAIAGGAGVVAGWIVLALERKRQRARREARDAEQDDASSER